VTVARSEVAAALEELEVSAVTALVSAVPTEEELEGMSSVAAMATVAVVTEEELEGMSSATAPAATDLFALYSVHPVFS